MDPKATIQRIIDAHDNNDAEEKQEALDDLLGWLKFGGYGVKLHDRCAFPAPSVCTAYWDDYSWLNHWARTGANVK